MSWVAHIEGALTFPPGGLTKWKGASTRDVDRRGWRDEGPFSRSARLWRDTVAESLAYVTEVAKATSPGKDVLKI
jgi:hypothetical protein